MRLEVLYETGIMATGDQTDEIRRSYGSWLKDRLTYEEVALILGVGGRTFRRYIDRYKESGLDGLADKRLTQCNRG
jgi:transposase